MASKMAQDSPRWLKMASSMPPRGPKTAPRRLQLATEPPNGTLKRPKSVKNSQLLNVYVRLALSHLMCFRGLKGGSGVAKENLP